MNITGLFIRRPVMTTLIMSGLLCFGLIAYTQLPVASLPNVDFPTVSVSANLAGADPETMAATVATPLERQFATIAGIDNITSSSTLGATQITIQFALDRNIDAAAQDVNSAISEAMPNLPTTMLPPTYHKQNPAAAPILIMALRSQQLPISTVDEYAETTIAQQLSMVEGVAQVTVWGSQTYAVRVQLDPQKLTSLGIAADQVAIQINQQNVLLPTGVIYGRDRTFTVQATGQLPNAAAFRRLIIAYHNDAPVRLEDVATVLDDVANNKTAAWYSDMHSLDRSVVLAVSRQPGTNTVEVTNAVKATLANIERTLPSALKVALMYDRSISIDAAVHDVKFTLVLALVLVVLVIFLFLRNVIATVIPSLTLPMAVIGTFSVMYLLNFSLDNLSLMALTLAVGFVVDDAIVMLENIVRHLEAGEKPLDAALNGGNEVGFTILSMTLSLAAVFIPLVFMGGIIGKLFNEFAITIMAAILVSGVVSLTLTPMLCSRFLKPEHHNVELQSRWQQRTERIFAGALRAYERSLGWVMKHRPLTLAFSAVILVLTAVLLGRVSKGLFPPDDTGQLNVTTESAQGTSFDEMVRLQTRAALLAMKDPYISSFFAGVGNGGGAATNQGNLGVTLKPLGQRPSADVCLAELSRRLSGIPGLAVFIQNPPSIRIGGRTSKALYQFTLQGPDLNQLYAGSNQLVTALRKVPLITDATSDLLNANPQVTIVIDRERAGQLGVTPVIIENSLAAAYNEETVSTIYTSTNEYSVVMEIEPKDQLDIPDLDKLWVRGTGGKPVPISELAHYVQTVGPAQVNHSGQLPSVTISFNVPLGGSLGAAVDAIGEVAKRTLPSSISMGFSGNAQAFQSSLGNMGTLLLVTVFVIYIILGILYESFIHPITILTGLPFATFGALLALWITGIELDLYGYVGIIMLIGIVKKNAIMMIDFAIAAERGQNKTPEAAIIEAASIRFRPIMMTTFAAIASTLPIAIGVGATAASRRPLGVVVVGGLAFSQIVTLYVTPVFYTYLDELQSWLGRKFAKLPWAERPPKALVPAPASGD